MTKYGIPTECIAEGCTSKPHGRGMCPKHYYRFRMYGSTDLPAPKPWNPDERFWPNVAKGPNCWEWTASRTKSGYGNLRVNSRVLRAHRVSYELAFGSIPDGLHLDHKCRNRACVNPNHLRVVTNKQNQENRIGWTNKALPRGVTKPSDSSRYRARVIHNRTEHIAGWFDDPEEASAAVIALRLKLYTHNDTDKRTA